MMRWLWTDRATAPILAAELLTRHVCAHPNTVLGLPTGRSALYMYRHLAELNRAGVVSFRDVTTFNLDEYVGLSETHPGSYHTYMRQHFLQEFDVRQNRVHIPNGTAPDLDRECESYDTAIRQKGGWDLVVLGLGRDGHIAFNEPGTPPHVRTHVATLTQSTREDNRTDFPEGAQPPECAITVGIGTILEARSVILLATGDGKGAALQALGRGAIDDGVPVTFLTRHGDVTVVADQSLWFKATEPLTAAV